MMKRPLMALVAMAAFGWVNSSPAQSFGPSVNTAVSQWGFDSVTHLSCIVGLTSTCQLPTSATVSASVAVAPLTTTSTGPTVTTGNTFQSVLASNSSRQGCLIQNPASATETLFVFTGANASATTAKSVNLVAGAAFSCAVGGLGVVTDNISVTAATTGHAFVVTSQ